MGCFRARHAVRASNSRLLVAIFLLTQIGCSLAMLDEKGEYKLCGTYPLLLFPHMTEQISGGLDLLVKNPRQNCSKRTQEEDRYRTYDGTCNNPGNRGATFSLIKRLIPPAYHGVDSPRQIGKDYKQLPSPRLVTTTIHKPKEIGSEWTLLSMQIGQFLDHDISAIAVPTQEDKPFRCCGVPANERHAECYPIEIPLQDTNFKKCMEFIRSEPARYRNGSIIHPRRHENVVTSFIDASMIYGSDLATASKLRDKDGKGALLKTSFYKGRERLPKGDPKLCVSETPDRYCAMAGDDRVNTQPGLTAVQTAFHLEHNRLARKLVAEILSYQGYRNTPLDITAYLETAPYPLLEKLFQTVRKILIAIWQNIVYGEFLPVVVGPEVMTKYKLWTGKRMQFDPDIDPSLENAFATAAYRFGHSLVSNLLRIDKDYFLKDVFSDSSHIRENYELMCQGLLSWRNPAEDFDPLVVDGLTNHLFANKKKNRPGLDLASINIQRGRDHGTAGINEYRKYFGKKPYVNFNQLNSATDLRSIYSHPDDIDLFTGGLCENRTEGAFVGETFAEILGMQFHDMKYGDRYFFETNDRHHGLSTEQLFAISQYSLSKVMCTNGQLEYVQVNPFFHGQHELNPIVPCKDLPDIELYHWASEFKKY